MSRRISAIVSVFLAGSALGTPAQVVFADNNPADRVQSSIAAFQNVSADPNKVIPPAMLRDCQGIAIIPKLVQAGFILGGRRGAGVMMVRNAQGRWSNPAFITVTGGSIGAQIGASSSDVVLLFMDKSAIAKVLSQDFAFGGKVSGVGGPTGVDVVSPADSVGKTYSYARSEGLFAGVALEGAKLAYDEDNSARYYNRPSITAREIFTNSNIKTPPAAVELQQAVYQASQPRR